MKHFNAILFTLYVCIAGSSAANVCDSLARVFDMELGHTQAYIDARQQRIDSILMLSTSAADNYYYNSLLSAEYQHYKSKEARDFISLNLEQARLDSDESRILESVIRLSYLLASAGNFNEAVDLMRPLNTSSMNKYEKAAYYDCMIHIYGEAGFYSQTDEMKNQYFQLLDLYDDSLATTIPTNSLRRYRQLENQWRNRGLYSASLSMNDSLLASTEEFSEAYAAYAFCRSETYRGMGDEQQQLEWLLRSAIADVRNGVTDNGSSWMVAQIYYNRGNLARAYRYIEYSLNNSNIYGATIRHGQIGPLMSIINNAYQHQLNRQRNILYGLLGSISLLVVLLLFLYIKMKRINQELKKVNIALHESNHVKEEYIAHYLNLYSEYIDRLKHFKKDPEFTQREIERFYNVFDSTFLSLYPDFVEEFNSLLVEDGRIIPKKNELLNTELRIFALIRLGIDNSARIAQLLRYSPNTIYNYRAKIKNMARGNRDNFEDQVRQIGTITM